MNWKLRTQNLRNLSNKIRRKVLNLSLRMLLANKINKLSFIPHHLLFSNSIKSSTRSWKNLNVQQNSSRNNSCISSLGTRDLLLLFYLEGLNMGGRLKISTPAVIERAPPFPYLRSKVGTVSAASPLLSGKMSAATASLFLTLIPSSSTSLPPASSKGVTERGSSATLFVALLLQ